MAEITVTELSVFPVKGCRAIEVTELEITEQGVKGDRGFAFWEDGGLVDQLKTPGVAAFAAGWEGETLVLDHLEKGRFELRPTAAGKSLETRYILDQFDTIDQGDAVADWASSALGKSVRLVTVGTPWNANLPLEEFKLVHGKPKDRFYAASPVSLANTASLDRINRDLDAPVPMNRFRMNVVVEGLPSWDEDRLVSVRSQGVELARVTVCERCAITETDQNTGERPRSGLLEALARHNRRKEGAFGSGLVFGAYMAVARPGTLRVGDELRVEY